MGKKVFDCPVSYDTGTKTLSALCKDAANDRTKSVKGDHFVWHNDDTTDIQSFTMKFVSGTDKAGPACTAPFDDVTSNPGLFWGSGINKNCGKELYYVADAVLTNGQTVSSDPIIIVGSFRLGPIEFVEVFASVAGILSLTVVAVIALFIGRATK